MAEKIGSLEFDIIGVDNLSAIVDASKARIQGLVDSTVKGGTSMGESFNKISREFEKAFGKIDIVIETNLAEIKKLEAEYAKLSSESGKAFQSGRDDDYRRIKARQDVLKSEIATRKQLVSEASKSNTELASLEEKVAAKVKVNAGAQKQLRTQLMLAREELAKMEAAGQRGSVAYQELQEKTGMLTKQMRSVQAQASVLADSQSGFQGIIQGLGGISSAMSAAAGAYGLFAVENENLQKIMTKVQSLMAITIGLQQISQTLNKNSAFMLVTVNGLKKWWNEITGKSVVVQTAEAVATKAATAAKKGQTGEIVKGTAATAGNTAATTAGTVATKGLAGGFKAVGLAIKSIPGIGWLVAGITAVIAAFTLLNKKQKEAREEQEKFTNSVAEIALEPVAKINELSSSYSRLGTSMKEKEKFVKDNQKAFNDLGVSVKTVADAENLLIKNKDAFIRAQIAKAKATVIKDESKDLIMLQIKAENKLDELRTKYKDYERKETTDEYALEPWEREIQLAELEVRMAETALKARFGLAEEYSEKAEKILDEAGIKGASETKTSGNYKSLLEKIKEQYDIYSKAITSTDEITREAAKEKYKTLIDYAETYLLYLEKERNKLLEIEKSGKKLTTSQKANLDNINKEIAELTQPDNKNDKSAIAEHSYTLQKEKIIQKYQKDIEDIKSKVGTIDIETGLTIDQKTVDEAIREITKKKNKELEDLMNKFYPKTDFSKLLDEYADFEQQRNAIAKKYKDIRDKMHEQNASDIKAGIPVTFKDENYKAVDLKEMEDIAAINRREIENLVRGSIKLSNIFTDIQFLSKQTAKQAIGDIKNIYAYLDSGGKTKLPDDLKDYADKIINDPQKLAEFYNNARALQEEYVNETANPFDNIIFAVNQLAESYTHLENAEKATTEEAKRYEIQQAKISRDTGLKMLGGYAVNAANGLQQMATYMREYAQASGDVNLEQQAESINDFASDLQAAASGAQSGGWIGAVIGYIGNIFTRTISSIVQTQVETAKLENALYELEKAAKAVNNEMLLSGEIRENIFGTDVYGKYLDAVALYKQAEQQLAESLKTTDSSGNFLSLMGGDYEKKTGLIARNAAKNLKKAYEQGYRGIELMQIKTKDRGAFLEGIGFGDKYTSLKDLYPKLFNSDGSLNIDQLKLFKSNKDLWNLLTAEQQNYFDSILSNAKLMDDALTAQEEYLSNLFSGLSDKISDAFWQAATEGTNAMATIGDSIDEIVVKWIRQQAYMLFIQPVFDKVEENMNMLRKQQHFVAGKWVDYTEEEIMEYGVKSLYNRLDKNYEAYNEYVDEVLERLGKKSDNLEVNTLSGAIKGASQESIDLLAGQTNAVRLNQVEALSLSRSQLFRLVSIDSGVQQIIQIMNANKGSNQIQTDPLRAKGVTTL